MTPLLTIGDTISDVVNRLLGLLNLLIWPMIGMAILFFFYGLIRYILKAGDMKGRALGRDAIIWGLIGMFVLFSLWGLVRMLQTAFFVGTPAEELMRGNQPI